MKKNELLEAASRLDNWMNLVTGLGTTLRDKRLSTAVGTPSVLTQQELEDLFAGNGLARKICQAPPFHQLRAWCRVVDGDGSQDLADDVQARVDELGIVSLLMEAATLARLHGSAVLIIGADDGQNPVQPLQEQKIKTLSWFTLMDRWGLQPERYYSDPLAPRYGLPEVYSISGGDTVPGVTTETRHGALIHESRIIRFDGTMTTRRRQIHNNGWNDSVFVALFEALRAYGHITASTETLVTDFAQAVYKYKGLAEVLAANGEDLVRARARVIDMMRSTLGAMVLDADGEEFERKATPITGLPELLDRWMTVVSAVADMPATVLFGRSPAGENATGESDMRNWYDRLSAERALHVAPKVERLIRLLMLAKDGPTRGKEPQDWRIVWNPLWQPTTQETTATRKTQAETDAIYIDRGVLHESEVAQSRFGGTEYSLETTLEDGMRDQLEDEQAETERMKAETAAAAAERFTAASKAKPGEDGNEGA
jgi:phage-related protein (TIGR01555 family)